MRKQVIMWLGLFATGLVAMSGTDAIAGQFSGGGTGGCACLDRFGACKTTTTCDRSRDLGTCDDINPNTGLFKCPIASLERSEFFAAAPGPEQTEICADTPSPEPVVTFADTPSPEQIATFAVLPNSKPSVILVAKPTPSPQPAPDGYECFSFGTGAGNLDNNPAAISCFFTPTRVTVNCENPAGEDGGQGTPFTPGVTVPGTNALDKSDISGRGKFSASNPYTQAQLFAAIFPNAVACKDNWSPIVNTVRVIDSTVDLLFNNCADGTTAASCEASIIQPPDDRLIATCTVSPTNNLVFNCTIEEHCKAIDDAALRLQCLCQAPSPSGGTVTNC